MQTEQHLHVQTNVQTYVLPINLWPIIISFLVSLREYHLTVTVDPKQQKETQKKPKQNETQQKNRLGTSKRLVPCTSTACFRAFLRKWYP